MAEEIENEKAEGEETAPKKSILKWIILGGLLISLGAGGFLGWRIFSNTDTDDQKELSEVPVDETSEGEGVEPLKLILPLESVVANLIDKSNLGKRYLKITIALEVSDDMAKEKVTKYHAQIKDTILMLLTSQTFEEVSTIEGKLNLKQTLLTRINQALGERIVSRIYFTEFVVQ